LGADVAEGGREKAIKRVLEGEETAGEAEQDQERGRGEAGVEMKPLGDAVEAVH
jgi:hypothetical protein